MKPEPLLAGLRVVEIGQYIAAPFAATLFADQGAEVVKIERPGGDPVPAPTRPASPRGTGASGRWSSTSRSDDGRAEALAR